MRPPWRFRLLLRHTEQQDQRVTSAWVRFEGRRVGQLGELSQLIPRMGRLPTWMLLRGQNVSPKRHKAHDSSGEHTLLAGSAAAERCACVTVVLAGGHGISMMALVGLPTSDLFSGEQERVRSIMKRFQVKRFSCVVGAVLIALLLTTAVAQAAAWTVVPSPSPGVESNVLSAVASVSANDVWAVGEATDATSRQLTLTEHWNGTAWSVVASPNVGSANNNLLAVAAVSTTDVWAVGKAEGPAGAQAPPLIEHWDGTSWRIVTAPRHVGVLNGITAVSTNDVWAVGQFSNASGVFQTLIEHWNGHTWRVVSSPNVGTHNNFLNGVTAVSASDIWAVGDFLPAANVPEQTLTLHWDGHTWSVVSSPNVGSGFNVLFAAAAVSTNDVWAVGEFGTPSGLGTLIEQWNGSSWSVISSPSAGELRGIAIVSATDIWAVGSVISSGVEQTVIEQWNGTSWNVVPSPNPSSSINLLDGAAADPSSGQAWAVGAFFNTISVLQTLTEFNP